MALIDLVTEDVIQIPMSSTAKNEVMRELATLLHRAGKIAEIEPVVEALLERERKGSTGLEAGLAVPHSKTPLVDGLTLAIGIAPNGIDFEALDGELSTLFFMLLAPPNQSGPHIEALSEIARLTQSRSFCNSLIGSSSAAEVVELFTE